MARDEAYYRAENKIEEAMRLGARELNLAEMALTELPESVVHLSDLTRLILGSDQRDAATNQLTSLPESLGELTQLQELDLSRNQLATLPESIGRLGQLKSLFLSYNPISAFPDSISRLTSLEFLELRSIQTLSLPKSLSNLTRLQSLDISGNKLGTLPEWLGKLGNLKRLSVSNNRLKYLPDWIWNLYELEELYATDNELEMIPDEICKLKKLRFIILGEGLMSQRWSKSGTTYGNKITDLPSCLGQLPNLQFVLLQNNPLNPELAAAHEDGIDDIKIYLRAKSIGGSTINYEAKLILVGEGEVGKTCLMDAILGKEWQEHPSTHGIEIQQIKVTHPDTQKQITLNGWDFGGQRVYRPTHQLFFSAPAVYLVVWKPREGPQQGFVKEWIQLVKRREPSAKILVVATHGGPQQRQPDIDRQELWDLFGKQTVVDFFFVDSKPDDNGKRKGIEELKRTIARVAATLPEVGRSVPKSFQDVRLALQGKSAPYLPLEDVLAICRAYKMDDEIARLFITISHRLGHLTHYENDPALRDIVILRPDWLATAMSYVLDDEQTRLANGLVKFSRLNKLWDDPSRTADTRYPATLHPIFLRLMERFDLSYRVADPSAKSDSDSLSLIGQLVPDIRPANMEGAWPRLPAAGDIQQTQICRIVDKQTGQSATAEGLFYQLIVRLHKYSLGRVNYNDSVHWQRGLVLDNAYNGRAFLEHKGNDIHITVRAPYPERFLAMLTEEVKYLVESFWEGLRCDVMVPCIVPCGKGTPGTNLFEVQKLIAFRRKGLKQFPCTNSGCEQLQDIDQLLLNAPAATQTIPIEVLEKQFAAVKDKLDRVDVATQRILSQVDKSYNDLLQVLTDEAKEGPRLLSLFPLHRSNFNPKEWIRSKFRLVLWCEHSRLPLPALNGADSKKGVYDLDLDREWFKKAAPYLKFLTGTLGMVLPVASSGIKLALDENAFKLIEEQLDFGKNVIDATIGEAGKVSDFLGTADTTKLEQGVAIRAENATLREVHTLLKAKDPGFGGLVRVMNKRQEFLWVHERFAGEY